MSAARHLRPLGVALLAALASCGMPPADGGAPTGDAGPEFRLGGDLIAARGELSVTGSVPGDVIVAGGQIDFSGDAGGDFLGAGGQQTIAGTIAGDVRAAGGQIEVSAQVTRNATLAGGDVALADASTIGRNAYMIGGTLRATGRIEGALTMSGGDVTIDGTVGGDVVVNAGTLTVGPRARIGGDLRYRVPEDGATIDPGAQVSGRTIPLPPPSDRRSWPGVLRLIWLGGFLVAGAVAILLFPVTAGRAADTLAARTAVSFGFGLLWLIAGPIAALVLAISVIGLPLAFIVATVWGVGLYLGPAVPSLWLGRRFLGSRIGTGRAGLVGSFLAAGVVLVLIGLVPILGPLVLFGAAIAGIGALVRTFAAPPTV